MRTRANSIYSLGIYIGGGLSALTTIIIGGVGWRVTFLIVGIVGGAFGIICLFFVFEPKRGVYDAGISKTNVIKPSLGAAFLELIKSPTSRWVTIAGGFRFWAGYSIGFFVPSYFGSVYENEPNYTLKFGIMMATAVSFGGFCSSLIGGYISDKYEEKWAFTKAAVCMVGTFLGIPTLAGCLLI
jgi:predicted MFS family arabinose efflux permease